MSSILKKTGWRLEVLAYDLLGLLIKPFSFDRISGFGAWLLPKIGPRTSKQHIARTGLRIAFPEKSSDEIETLLVKQWQNTGRSFAEFPILHRVKVFAEKSRVRVIGHEHLDAVKANTKTGAVFFSGHFANIEIMAAVLSQYGVNVRVTYRRINNPYMDRRVQQQREAYGIKYLVQKNTHRGARELINALKNGESIAIMNDQKFNTGISVPFFGEPAMTAPGAVRLAIQTGAPLIPLSITREGARFTVTIHPPLDIARKGEREAITEAGTKQVTAFIEDRIRENPDQWFWVHRRWPNAVYEKS